MAYLLPEEVDEPSDPDRGVVRATTRIRVIECYDTNLFTVNWQEVDQNSTIFTRSLKAVCYSGKVRRL